MLTCPIYWGSPDWGRRGNPIILEGRLRNFRGITVHVEILRALALSKRGRHDRRGFLLEHGLSLRGWTLSLLERMLPLMSGLTLERREILVIVHVQEVVAHVDVNWWSVLLGLARCTWDGYCGRVSSMLTGLLGGSSLESFGFHPGMIVSVVSGDVPASHSSSVLTCSIVVIIVGLFIGRLSMRRRRYVERSRGHP